MEILRVEHLRKIYGKGENAVHALDDVSFSVEQGQFVAIIGPSGSGKSTLLHILGGLDTTDSGEVNIDGVDITKLDETSLSELRNKKIGFIFQSHYLLEEFDAIENVMLPFLMNNYNKNEGHILSIVYRSDNAPSSKNLDFLFFEPPHRTTQWLILR